MRRFRDLGPEDRAFYSRQHLYEFIVLVVGAVVFCVMRWFFFRGCALMAPWGCVP